ncbi:Type 1 protein exporter [Pleurotus pulmonarius]
MRRSRQKANKRTKRKGTFDPEHPTNIKHTRLGVWDLYDEVAPELVSVPGSSSLETYMEMVNNLPYVWRMLKDIVTIPSCLTLLVLYLILEFAVALVPAVSLWYSSQMLIIVQTAVDKRTVDTRLLSHVALGRFGCAVVTRLLLFLKFRIMTPLNTRIKLFYSQHVFRANVRLDVPTFDDGAVQRQLEETFPRNSRSSIAWDTVVLAARISSTFLRLFSEVTVLVTVLHEQRDGLLLAALCFAQSAAAWMSVRKTMHPGGVWAATTKDDDYIKMQGLKQLVTSPEHRKEIVAGGLWEYCVSLYHSCLEKVGDAAAMDFYDALHHFRTSDRLSISSFLNEPLKEAPHILFTLRAVQYPASIPVSVTSLHLVMNTTQTFIYGLFSLLDETRSVADQLSRIRNIYEVGNIPNKIADGKEPYPENQQSLTMGMGIEFRNVSFKYPGSEEYALHNVSFKIERGQLCVIVGSNGSGKSTILKLIARLYDPCEGEILIDDRDIRTLKLADLRRATSVLFQDYTHFPLSIRDNIGLGDPDNADDEEMIMRAATLGGAKEFIDKLPEGFNTYLDRPVRDYYSGLPEGTKTLFGRPVDYSSVRTFGNISSSGSIGLSGGQMQRIALSRTFMRSLASESKVGLLLFDEPSASLDPTAEHDLFERLRQLRGNKTMIFSSHRFGNLTRHADLILYMNDSVVVEEGTHDGLIKKNGEYARIWMLQAQAFLP